MVSCSSVKSPWLQGHTTQLCVLQSGILLQQVSHFLLCSICSFLSVRMCLFPPDPPLLSELCLRSASNLVMGAFLGPTAVHTMGSVHRREVTGPLTAALCICHLSHQFLLTCPKEKSLQMRLATTAQGLWSNWQPDNLAVWLSASSPLRGEQQSDRRRYWRLQHPPCLQLTAQETGVCWLPQSCRDVTKLTQCF